MRRPIIAANWKLHMLQAEARAFVAAFRATLDAAGAPVAEVVIAPPFTALAATREALAGSEIALAAQDVCAEASGAFTGEVSAAMLADAGCRYGLVGHSERRALYGERSEDVARKATALLDAGLRPIVCVGETRAQREAGDTEKVLAEQLDGSLAGIGSERAEQVVLAYEPVWAIGTGLTASPEQAQAAHRFLRDRLAGRYGATADAIRIQYGGSVKPDNAAALLAEADIDGALVGGASLDPGHFARIVHFDRSENRAP